MTSLFCLLVAFGIASFGANRVRHVVVHKDQIVQVRTSIGIATIVQVPDRPNSVVVGDQDSFKVEYLDQAITIKPLKGGAKSNLYVYTDWQRYNVQLITGPESTADFVVYLEHPEKKPDENRTPIKWHSIDRIAEVEGLRIEVLKAATTPELVLIQIEITATNSQRIDPSWFWLSQGTSVRPINSLVLSSLEVNPVSKINGMIQVKRSDIQQNESIQIEVRRKKKITITIPKVTSWKK